MNFESMTEVLPGASKAQAAGDAFQKHQVGGEGASRGEHQFVTFHLGDGEYGLIGSSSPASGKVDGDRVHAHPVFYGAGDYPAGYTPWLVKYRGCGGKTTESIGPPPRLCLATEKTRSIAPDGG